MPKGQSRNSGKISSTPVRALYATIIYYMTIYYTSETEMIAAEPAGAEIDVFRKGERSNWKIL